MPWLGHDHGSSDPNCADLQSWENPYSDFADLSLANGQKSVKLLFDAGQPADRRDC
ncbi:MAG: hypothetical protein R2867_11060 [Caldilineaceae bacterium]